jgi:uncharacterized protein YndB with AHSA1/START domain
MLVARYERHAEAMDVVRAPVAEVFEYLDDPARLSAHMSERSWMMGGGRMDIVTDGGRGMRVGSRVRLGGRAFGMSMLVEGVVTEHEPPRRKAWATVGGPHLIVIGRYRMAIDVEPQDASLSRGSATRVRVGIDYDLPPRGLGRLLGLLFGTFYARWCTSRMVADAARHFERAAAAGSDRVNARV